MIDLLWLMVDALLVTLLLILGWITCASTDIKRGITLFTAFGLLLALIWARLRAPDLALAEAVIGAGISGALLLRAINDHKPLGSSTPQRSAWMTWSINLMALALFCVMSWSMWLTLDQVDSTRLSQLVLSQLDDSGVSNPVTAVLLNFRAYDTLLELAVVLTAVLAILALSPMRSAFQPAGVLLTGMLRWLVPVLIVSAGYLLWVGAHAPGGAFQAGAMLAAAMILLHQGGYHSGSGLNLMLLRVLLVIGIALFVGIGLVMMLLNQSFLDYSPGWAGLLILVIETAATVSIAAALTLAFVGGRPDGWEPVTDSSNPSNSAEFNS
ncbi:MAG: DUF4040 domain-containing protein [Gammaproteobacteria bacterium]|nr:DUF4040 domain-containing protein [Gammaproteobacteria bacterium]